VAGGRAVVRDLRRVNRGSVLRLLFFDGPLNRVELGALTGLSSGSVTNLCAALLEEGLIIEVGQEQSEGGRPRVQLDVNRDFGGIIGVEIGESGVRVEAFDFRLGVLDTVQVDLHPMRCTPEVTIAAVTAAIDELVAMFNAAGRLLLGVGIAVPGMVEYRGDGSRVHAPNLGWHGVPLEQLVSERVGAPVFVENGAKALGQVEMWLGAGRGAQHAVVALWGTGVGSAIFVSGVLYRGATSSAGEWGHACVVVGGRMCRCGSAGCLEAYIGAEGLLSAWQEADPKAPLSDPDEEEWADQLLEAASLCPGAQQTLEQAATFFGVGCANLANLFNPELIVVGGWLGHKFGPALMSRIAETMQEQALDYAAAGVELALGHFGDDAVALGASTLVVAELLATGGTLPASPAARTARAAWQ
jgi:predicted NBD/HSP70 family sugar kinase